MVIVTSNGLGLECPRRWGLLIELFQLIHQKTSSTHLTLGHFLILLTVADLTKTTHKGIAEHLDHISRASISRYIMDLEGMGLVSSEVDRENRRRKFLEITPIGQEHVTALYDAIDITNITKIKDGGYRKRKTTAPPLVQHDDDDLLDSGTLMPS